MMIRLTKIQRFFLPLLVLLAGLVFALRADAEENFAPANSIPRAKLHSAVERGLEFLDQDARKWRREHDCATCHHGAMTLFAFSEARRAGFAVSDQSLADIAAWNKTQFFHPFDAAKDLSPHWRTMPLALSTILLAADGTALHGISAQDLASAEVHFLRRQEPDGSWSAPPPAHGPQPVFESKEIMTLRATLALQSYIMKTPQDTQARQSIARAAEWLNKIPPTDTTQAAVFRLWLDARSGRSPEALQPAIDRLLQLQNPDGGWSQTRQLQSDAYSTGEALCALTAAKVDFNSSAIIQGQRFLLTAQQKDGSWSMIPRETPQRKASTNLVPLIYFGSAWATLGLIRTTPGAE